MAKTHISRFQTVVHTLDQICQRSNGFERVFLQNTKLSIQNLPMNLVTL